MYPENFSIPIRDDDLLEENGDLYYVKIRPSLDEIVSKVFQFRRDIESKQWQKIINKFDYIFFTLKCVSESEPWRLRSQLLPCLISGMQQVTESLQELVPILVGSFNSSVESFPDSPAMRRTNEVGKQRDEHRCAFLMYTYMMARLGFIFERESINKQLDVANNVGRKRRKPLFEKGEDEFMDKWMNERGKLIDVLRRTISLTAMDGGGKQRVAAIRFLWQPSIACPNFLRIHKEFIYKLLENPELGKISERAALQKIFGYLRILCVDFEQFPKVSFRLISLMKRLDYLAAPSIMHSPFLEAIEAVSQYNDMDPLILSMLASLGRLSKADFSRTDVSARPFALFITSLAEKRPKLLDKHMVNIVSLLCDDQSTLRCAVLNAFAEIVVEVYKGNLCEGSRRRTRDRLLLRLQDHIIDVNANVRSRILQIWTRLARCRRIPISFINGGLVQDACDRLSDKAVTVRKNAATFLTVLLQHNPFAPTLCSSKLSSLYCDLQKQALKLKNSRPESEHIREALDIWIGIKDDLYDWVCASLKFERLQLCALREENAGAASSDNMVETDEVKRDCDNIFGILDSSRNAIIDSSIPIDELRSKIPSLLLDEKHRRACVEIFVTMVVYNRIQSVKISGTDDQIATRINDVLSTYFLEAYITNRLQDDDTLLQEEDRLMDYKRSFEEMDNKIQCCENTLLFALALERCLSTMLQTIMTCEPNELAEIIAFIVEASKFSVQNADSSVRELFIVIWRRDVSAKEAAVKAVHELLISINPDREICAKKSAENLLKVIIGVPEKDRISIEEAIYRMVCKQMWSSDLLDVLASVLFQTQGESRIAAMRLFSIVSRANKQYMRDRFDFFVEFTRREGFFEGDDGSIALEYCNMVSMLGTSSNRKECSDITESPFRIPEDHRIIQCVKALITSNVAIKNYNWIRVMHAGLNVIFYLCSKPSNIIRLLALDIFLLTKYHLASCIVEEERTSKIKAIKSRNESNCEKENIDISVYDELLSSEMMWLRECDMEEEDSAMDFQTNCLTEDELGKIRQEFFRIIEMELDNEFNLWDMVAQRYCAFVGQVALKTLIYIDVTFVAEIKRKCCLIRKLSDERDWDSTMKQFAAKIREISDDTELTPLEEDSLGCRGMFELCSKRGNEYDAEQSEAAANERFANMAHSICETGVFGSDKLIRRLIPFVIEIVLSEGQCFSEDLRSAAILALSKVMLLSTKFCAKYMPIFMKFLNESLSAECRNNLLIAASDLCFRFPNVLEPYSVQIFERIHDRDIYVRQTCIIILSYLILNDMIKVQGAVANISKCTIDSNDNVANLAKCFFSEFSKKGNAIYNIMPDVISRLCSDASIEIVDFERIMKLLLGFIVKDKQVDSLAEKLCEKLQKNNEDDEGMDERLPICISFCISRLQFSEKSIRMLIDSLSMYKHHLSMEPVFNNFSAAVVRCKKLSIRNTDLKSDLDTFFTQLLKSREEELLSQGLTERTQLNKKFRKPSMKAT